MFWLLMRVRLLSARNVMQASWQRNPVATAFACLASVTLFGGMFLGFLIFFRFAAHLGVQTETVYQMLYFLFLFLLAGAVPFVASTLLQSADYSLLFAAPTSPRVVVAAKLLDATITNSLQFTILGIPALFACAVALDFGLMGWLLLPLVVALFVLLPALLTALGLLLALWLLGMKRLRGAVTLINVLMAVVVCLTFVVEARNLPLKLAGGTASLTSLQASMTVSPSAHAAPSHWFGDLMLALSPAYRQMAPPLAEPLGLLLLLVGGLFIGAMLLGGKLLSAATVAEEDVSRAMLSVPTSRSETQLWRRLFRRPSPP